ncbi:MAG: mechanosensitive ion channel [Deltaproteobacteria bacterium]|nr:mechanosensitive ion channel [Deltaproteobacteria bacterium]MBN2671879.1 mechanosensitive ion channel [Deltaproteobacteria bacterium]
MPDVGTNNLMQAFNPGAIPYALAWVLGAFVLMRITRRVLRSLSERMAAYRLTIKQLDTLLSFLVYLVAFILAATSLFTLSSEALLALSGTIAVTAGFALKDVAASFMAGLAILFTKPFQVGDRISFGGYYGEVKEIGLRSVRLVTLDDNLVSIPTNKFLTEPVASANAGELDCMVVMNFYVSPAADHKRAREIVDEAVLASKFLYLGKPMTTLLTHRLTEQGQLLVEIVAKAYVYDARQEKAFASDVTDRVLSAFRQEAMLPNG